ncbi:MULTISPECIES: hypothetical protein [unclassified Nocardioides]|uniref:hypothetical protein n=1 Tax=unclassified Nocardioides TaxID=2615069 RepID=UPI0030150A5F
MLTRHDLATGPRPPGPDWDTVARALHRRTSSGLSDLHAWQQALRQTAAFTHLTSARVRGWWLPPLPDPLPVWVAQIEAQHASRRRGLIACRHRAIPPSEVIDGLRLTTVPETLVACGRDLGLLDLVVLVDCALQHHQTTTDELWTAAREHRRGAPRLREALVLADGRAESAWETLLRVLHVVCDVPVEPQQEIWTPDGRHVARADLRVLGTRFLHEYDGVDHLPRARQRRDLERGRRIIAADLERRGYTSEHVLHQAVGILRDADLALGRPHDPGRIQAWHALLRESLFTPAGQARFRSRLGSALEK